MPSPKSSKPSNPGFCYLHMGGELLLILLPAVGSRPEVSQQTGASLHVIYPHKDVKFFLKTVLIRLAIYYLHISQVSPLINGILKGKGRSHSSVFLEMKSHKGCM